MVVRLAAVAVIGLALLLAFVVVDGEDGVPAAPSPRAVLARNAGQTLAAGPMRVEAIVRAPRFGYRVAARLDPAGGYRLCGPIRRAPNRYWLGVRLWLEGRRGAYGTLTARGESCAAGSSWFDDHPPTLPFERRLLAFGTPGAEDYLHAGLVALTGLRGPALGQVAARECGSARCYAARVDFGRLDREPPSRDEDGWTLRPLLRALGLHPVSVRVNAAGFVNRIVLQARPRLRGAPRPVRVELQLSRFGEPRGVPHVVATAIE